MTGALANWRSSTVRSQQPMSAAGVASLRTERTHPPTVDHARISRQAGASNRSSGRRADLDADAAALASSSSASSCESVAFHQVSIAPVTAVIASLQAQQAELDARRAGLPAVSSSEDAAELVPELVAMNLCDGTEDDGDPGVTIVRALMETMAPLQAAAPVASSSFASSSPAPRRD